MLLTTVNENIIFDHNFFSGKLCIIIIFCSIHKIKLFFKFIESNLYIIQVY